MTQIEALKRSHLSFIIYLALSPIIPQNYYNPQRISIKSLHTHLNQYSIITYRYQSLANHETIIIQSPTQSSAPAPASISSLRTSASSSSAVSSEMSVTGGYMHAQTRKHHDVM